MKEIYLPNIIGSIAGVLTTIAFLPQLYKTWRSKTAEDISLSTFILFVIGVFLWCIYGFEIHSYPVILANIITLIISILIITLKLIYVNSNKANT
mgnify:CR=1 FL=1